jgi:hypothetical protein
MPHDRTGQLIEVGEEVTIRCRVAAIHAGTEYCNLTLASVEPMYPSKDKSTFSANGRQVDVASPPLVRIAEAQNDLRMAHLLPRRETPNEEHSLIASALEKIELAMHQMGIRPVEQFVYGPDGR